MIGLQRKSSIVDRGAEVTSGITGRRRPSSAMSMSNGERSPVQPTMLGMDTPGLQRAEEGINNNTNTSAEDNISNGNHSISSNNSNGARRRLDLQSSTPKTTSIASVQHPGDISANNNGKQRHLRGPPRSIRSSNNSNLSLPVNDDTSSKTKSGISRSLAPRPTSSNEMNGGPFHSPSPGTYTPTILSSPRRTTFSESTTRGNNSKSNGNKDQQRTGLPLTNTPIIADEADDLYRLERENFELKMQVYDLKTQVDELQRQVDGDVASDFGSSSDSDENNEGGSGGRRFRQNQHAMELFQNHQVLKRELQMKNQELDRMRRTLVEQRNSNEDNVSLLDDDNEHIQKLEEELQEVRKQLKACTFELHQRDEILNEAGTALEELQTQCNQWENKLSDVRAEHAEEIQRLHREFEHELKRMQEESKQQMEAQQLSRNATSNEMKELKEQHERQLKEVETSTRKDEAEKMQSALDDLEGDWRSKLKKEMDRTHGIEMTLSQERHNHSMEVQQLQGDILRLQSRYDHTASKLDDKERRYAQAEIEFKQKLELRECSIKKQDDEIKSLQIQLESRNSSHQQAETQQIEAVKRLTEQFSKARAQVVELQEEVYRGQSKSGLLEQQLASVKRQHETYSTEAEERERQLQSHIGQLQAKVYNTQSSLEQGQAELAQTKSDLDEERRRHRQQVQQLESEIDALQSNMEVLQTAQSKGTQYQLKQIEQLQEDLESTKSTLEEASDKIATLENERVNIEQQLNEEVQNVQALSTQIKQYQTELSGAQNKNETVQKENDAILVEAEKAISKLTTERDEVQGRLDNEMRASKELEAALQEKLQEIDSLNEQVLRLKTERDDLQRRLDEGGMTSEKEIAKMRQNVYDLQQALEKRSQEMSDLVNETVSTREELKVSEESHQVLQEQLDQYKKNEDELSAWETQVQEWQKKWEESQDQLEEQDQLLDQAHTAMQEMEIELKQTKEKLKEKETDATIRYRNEVQNLQRDFEKISQQAGQMQEKLQQATEKIASLEHIEKGHKQELEQSHQTLERMRATLEEQKQQAVQELEKSLQAYKEDIEDKLKETKGLQNEISELKKNGSLLLRQLDASREEKAALQQQLSDASRTTTEGVATLQSKASQLRVQLTQSREEYEQAIEEKDASLHKLSEQLKKLSAKHQAQKEHFEKKISRLKELTNSSKAEKSEFVKQYIADLEELRKAIASKDDEVQQLKALVKSMRENEVHEQATAAAAATAQTRDEYERALQVAQEQQSTLKEQMSSIVRQNKLLQSELKRRRIHAIESSPPSTSSPPPLSSPKLLNNSAFMSPSSSTQNGTARKPGPQQQQQPQQIHPRPAAMLRTAHEALHEELGNLLQLTRDLNTQQQLQQQEGQRNSSKQVEVAKESISSSMEQILAIQSRLQNLQYDTPHLDTTSSQNESSNIHGHYNKSATNVNTKTEIGDTATTDRPPDLKSGEDSIAAKNGVQSPFDALKSAEVDHHKASTDIDELNTGTSSEKEGDVHRYPEDSPQQNQYHHHDLPLQQSARSTGTYHRISPAVSSGMEDNPQSLSQKSEWETPDPSHPLPIHAQALERTANEHKSNRQYKTSTLISRSTSMGQQHAVSASATSRRPGNNSDSSALQGAGRADTNSAIPPSDVTEGIFDPGSALARAAALDSMRVSDLSNKPASTSRDSVHMDQSRRFTVKQDNTSNNRTVRTPVANHLGDYRSNNHRYQTPGSGRSTSHERATAAVESRTRLVPPTSISGTYSSQGQIHNRTRNTVTNTESAVRRPPSNKSHQTPSGFTPSSEKVGVTSSSHKSSQFVSRPRNPVETPPDIAMAEIEGQFGGISSPMPSSSDDRFLRITSELNAISERLSASTLQSAQSRLDSERRNRYNSTESLGSSRRGRQSQHG